MLDVTKIVGENIKRLRVEHGWTQEYLAQVASAPDPSTISGLERGVRGLSVKSIQTMCKALSCEPADLFQLPDKTDGDLVKRQLMREINIMCREDVATLCAHAVALNAQRGIKPE